MVSTWPDISSGWIPELVNRAPAKAKFAMMDIQFLPCKCIVIAMWIMPLPANNPTFPRVTYLYPTHLEGLEDVSGWGVHGFPPYRHCRVSHKD